jgi:hypothetical protein
MHPTLKITTFNLLSASILLVSPGFTQGQMSVKGMSIGYTQNEDPESDSALNKLAFSASERALAEDWEEEDDEYWKSLI